MSAVSLSAPALATFRDLRRRPALVLATFAVAVLLWLLPDICIRAVDDSYALALEAGVSTIATFATLVAGVAALRAGAEQGDLSAAPEWRAAPLGAGAYVAGRFLGIMAAAAALIAVLAPVLILTQLGSLRDDTPDATVAATALTGALFAAAQLAAVALLLATVVTPQMAALGFVATLALSRTVVPDLAARGGPAAMLAAVLPDPQRLDWSRELAFHRSLDLGSAALALAASALATIAFLAAAAYALARRET